ncbi:hypothetical protein F5Y17DRAFT_411723 [Xylariaceae sp. FL0594]|nr:hypothetical protein F5Y17DRAFT_411723 [Xylariaceae sp. FL0594]
MSSQPATANSNVQEKTFKQRLDEAAREARLPPSNKNENGEQQTTLLGKVTEAVPAIASKVLGSISHEEEQEEGAKNTRTGAGTEAKGEEERDPLSGKPNRPEHDDHIAEFLREQHRSKKLEGDGDGSA